jgi:hypothetical protein
MTNQIRRAVVIGLAAAVLAWAAEGAEPVQKDPEAERLDRLFKETMAQVEALDGKLYEHLKRVPAEPLLDLMEERIRGIAGEIEEMGTVGVKVVPGAERLRLADGGPSPIELYRMEISGRSRFGDVHLLLIRLQGTTSRMAALETLRVKAEEGGTVSFTARVAYPRYRDGEDPAADTPRSPEEMLGAMVRKRELTLKLLEDLSARAQVGRLVDALIVFGNKMEGQAVGLTELLWDGLRDGKAVLQGVLLGKSAEDGLRPALAKAGFLVEDVRTSPAGRCQAFTVTAGVKPAERSDEYEVRNGLFEHGTDAFCQPVARAAARVVARGAAPAGQALTLHLRDVEPVEVFILLNELTSASFLLDEDVNERISVDVEGATLEEVLAAMGSAGLAVGSGPVRWVTRAGKAPAAIPAADFSAEPMDIKNRDADLTEVLCTFVTVTERPILAPPDLRGAFSIYGTNLRVDQIIGALAAAAGLVPVVDGDRLLLGRGTADEVRGRKDAVNVCEIRVPYSPSGSRWALLSPELEKLAAGDLELAGLVRQGDTWTAWAFTPTRKLKVLKAGDKLSGASVSAVGPGGVTLATAGSGSANLTLRP